ncbi:MAG: lysoplasmalogenase family protein, partial [Promethearchaeota archaeon]
KIFKVGVVMFLLGIQFYIDALISDIKFKPFSILILTSIIVYILIGWRMINYLKNDVERFKIQTIVYIIAIESMNFFAFYRAVRSSNELAWLTFIGSVISLVSDPILAAIKFKRSDKTGGLKVVLTQTLAQSLFMMGFLPSLDF